MIFEHSFSQQPALSEEQVQSAPSVLQASEYESIDESRDHNTDNRPVLSSHLEGNTLHLLFREDVDLSSSMWFVNGIQSRETILYLQEDGEYHLTYELRNDRGEILASSEKTFLIDTTAPMISTSSSADHLWVYESENLLYQVSDENLESVQVFVDDQLVSCDGLISISRNNRKIRISARDAFGNVSEKEILILPLPYVSSEWAKDPSSICSQDVLQFCLEGDFEGMVLQLTSRDQIQTIPFESAHLQVSLKDGQSYDFDLIHPQHGIIHSWHVVSQKEKPGQEEIQKPETEEEIKEEVQDPQEQKPQEQKPVQPDKTEQTSPIVQTTAPSTSQLPAFESIETSWPAVTQSIHPGQDKHKPSVVLPASVLLMVNGKPADGSQTIFFEKLPELTIEASNAEMQSIQYSPLYSSDVFDSLKEAIENYPNQAIVLSAICEDEASKLSTFQFSFMPTMKAGSDQKDASAKLETSFYLDEQGRLCKIDRSEKQPMQAVLMKNFQPVEQEIQSGQMLQLYLQGNSEDISVVVNGKEMDICSLQIDENGLSYLPIQAKGKSLDISLVDTVTQEVVWQTSTAMSQPQVPAGWISWLIGSLGGIVLHLKRWYV